MNSFERVMNRFEGKEVDKIPNLNIIMAFGAHHIGVTYKEFVTDYRKLVEANLYCCEQFGIDAVSCISDPMREASGFGATLVLPEYDVPYCKEPYIQDYSQLKDLKPVDPFKSERMLDRIRAVELYKQKVSGKYPIIGWVEGVLAEAADLRDINEIMVDIITEPEYVEELFEIIYEQQYKFMEAQVKAGADIIGVGNAAASLIGPDLYREHVLKYEKRIIDDIRKLGAKSKLHICGDITSILDLIVEVAPDMVDIDWMVDFELAVNKFKGTSICAAGNLDPVTVFLQGNKETLTKAVNKCIDVADSKTFIAGGCEIPKFTPIENMITMDKLLYL
ncbi:uroporphyrinogen decarboxylase [Candidatus Epulonipiscium fishelsonii]|uniref:Uroporphyrinogen decarboxylase n=1 Tax=Candidatus Epulonipiscium fishelsonii TaxID=77094 RepID=A0ACC8XC25_9FIRM|nr:uroporphyrinogen decarboxylase [Epulopiscium sp. SCG-B05WGA-EpuloA1]ONI40029.1 uroporphyrinogen decarboxylase [Epulopiscium sp. SCG-B11WGA-EpuloA1]